MITALLILVGLSVGSFVNVLIDRLPRGQTVTWDRSRCDHCHRTLRWFELIPLVSYIVLGGRCLRCKKKLKFQYPAIETVVALGFVLIYHVFSPPPVALIALLVMYVASVVMVVVDERHQILPDSMIVLLLAGALVWVASTVSMELWIGHIISGVLSGGGLFLIWAATRGRGMGFGDVKLAFVLGILLGFPGIVVSLYVAFLTGALVGVILILAKAKGLKSKIAFGPFLIAGGFVAFLWTNQIMSWWKELL